MLQTTLLQGLSAAISGISIRMSFPKSELPNGKRLNNLVAIAILFLSIILSAKVIKIYLNLQKSCGLT
jgi:hypothetical protein